MDLELEPGQLNVPTAAPVKGKWHFVGSVRSDHLSIIGMFDLWGGKRDKTFLNMARVLTSL